MTERTTRPQPLGDRARRSHPPGHELHVWRAPCGCAKLECSGGCSVEAILAPLGLRHEDTLCARHRAEYEEAPTS